MDIIDSLLEIKLADDEDFLKVKETLSRIGIASRKDNTLYQSAHILHKRGKYYIVHFKQLLALDGKPSSFSLEDKERLTAIANRLEDWGLVKIVDPERFPKLPFIGHLKILSHKDKANWNLVTKYSIGNQKTT
jgi:hypothetical protein